MPIQALPAGAGLADTAGPRAGRAHSSAPGQGAYWDSEIKQCGPGLDGYPVYTRKEGTDTSYLACARYLLPSTPRRDLPTVRQPQRAYRQLHPGHGRAAAQPREFEFQRLHGMGDALYDTVIEKYRKNVRLCAGRRPQGPAAPLVRRLLENGANSSFVHQLVDPRVPVESLIDHPLASCAGSPRWATRAFRCRRPCTAIARTPKGST